VAGEERGSVTAETVVLLPVLLLVVAFAGSLVQGYRTELRVQDAAKVAARSIVRGDGVAAATRLATAAGPPGVELRVSREDGLVRVDARDWFHFGQWLGAPAPVAGLLPPFGLRASAVAEDEP